MDNAETEDAYQATPSLSKTKEATTMETLQEQLERVQAAIAAIESGAQEYGTGRRTVRKGDLKTLYEREANLKQQIAYETIGTTRAYACWPTR